MPAYVIVDVNVKDPTAFQEYVKNVPAIIRKHGGQYLAVEDAPKVMEGNWFPRRIVLVQFPDMKAADSFHSDPEYAPWKALRQHTADSNMVAFDGLGS